MFILLCLLFAFTIPTLSFADEPLTAIPQPDPKLDESTLIEGTGWSLGRTQNESLACEVAYNRARKQSEEGLRLAKQKRLVTAEELQAPLNVKVFRTWDRAKGHCTVKMLIEIPAIPKAPRATTLTNY